MDCPNCADGCQAARFCPGCETWLCAGCYQDHNTDVAEDLGHYHDGTPTPARDSSGAIIED